MRILLVFIIILAGYCKSFAAEGGGRTPTFALEGDVTLTSHYVEHGISHSDNSPALQGAFWFNFGSQFRLGLWGSNTNFENSDDHFNLRGNAEIKVDFSPNSHAVLHYSQNTYYNGGDHNGNILGLHLHFWDFRVLYETNSNWEATDEASTRFAMGKLSTVMGNWRWNNEAGYNMPQDESYNPYFDVRTGLGRKVGVIFVEGALTGTSESSQFHGAGDFFFILTASTDL